MKNQNKTNIGLGSVVKAKFGELEGIKREVRSRSMRKEVVVCVKDVVGKKDFLVQFEYGQNKGIIYSSLVFLSSKENFEMDEPLSHSPKKEQGELLTIVGDTEVGEPCIFGKGIYLSLFYCLFYEMDNLQICRRKICRKRDIHT